MKIVVFYFLRMFSNKLELKFTYKVATLQQCACYVISGRMSAIYTHSNFYNSGKYEEMDRVCVSKHEKKKQPDRLKICLKKK